MYMKNLWLMILSGLLIACDSSLLIGSEGDRKLSEEAAQSDLKARSAESSMEGDPIYKEFGKTGYLFVQSMLKNIIFYEPKAAFTCFYAKDSSNPKGQSLLLEISYETERLRDSLMDKATCYDEEFEFTCIQKLSPPGKIAVALVALNGRPAARLGSRTRKTPFDRINQF